MSREKLKIESIVQYLVLSITYSFNLVQFTAANAARTPPARGGRSEIAASIGEKEFGVKRGTNFLQNRFHQLRLHVSSDGVFSMLVKGPYDREPHAISAELSPELLRRRAGSLW